MQLLTIATADLTDNRRFAHPVAPARRGWEDATYERTYANPYPAQTPHYTSYHAAFAAAIETLHQPAPGATLRRRPREIGKMTL